MDAKRCRKITQKVIIELRHLPELQETIAAIEKETNIFGLNPYDYIAQQYGRYIEVIKDLSTLSSSDINCIHRANQQCASLHMFKGSAAAGGLDYFLSVLGRDAQKQLYTDIKTGINPDSPIFVESLKDLSDRMTKGHWLAELGSELRDGVSKEADYAIWGHTKGLSPRATIHFVLCHFLERVFTAQFSRYPDPKVRDMVKQKDTLLAAMMDLLLFRNAQQKVDRVIIDLWTKSRKDGGLQWISKDRLNIYNQLLS